MFGYRKSLKDHSALAVVTMFLATAVREFNTSLETEAIASGGRHIFSEMNKSKYFQLLELYLMLIFATIIAEIRPRERGHIPRVPALLIRYDIFDLVLAALTMPRVLNAGIAPLANDVIGASRFIASGLGELVLLNFKVHASQLFSEAGYSHESIQKLLARYVERTLNTVEAICCNAEQHWDGMRSSEQLGALGQLAAMNDEIMALVGRQHSFDATLERRQ